MNRVSLYLIVVVMLASCSGKPVTDPGTGKVLVFTGATIIDGEGGEPIRDGIITVRDGRFEIVGSLAASQVPAGAETHDLQGKYIVPGVINAHGHVGETKGIEGGHYSKDNVLDNLRIYARYGVTTVVSLGGDGPDAESVRDAIDPQEHDTTGTIHARLYIAGAVITGNSPEEAIAVTDSNAHLGVDIMKIRVDDNLGTSQKMPENIYRAVINRSHELGFKLAAHMYYLDDARKLVDAGADVLAHSVRDQVIPAEFIGILKMRKVPYCPTLTRELSTYVYADTPSFFADPFFTREYDSATVAPLKVLSRQEQVRQSKAAQTYKSQLPVAMQNLKNLSDAGAPIVFGTDSGVPTRFMGYFEHIEMTMMREAGLTPMQIIVSWSKTAAEMLGLRDLGVIKPNHRADFVVLDADPLENIDNMRRIQAVYIGGNEVPGSGN